MSFTVRIELHKVQPGEDSYNILHNAIHEEGFTNTIRADSGKLFELPSAEYNYESASTNDDIYEGTKSMRENWKILLDFNFRNYKKEISIKRTLICLLSFR